MSRGGFTVWLTGVPCSGKTTIAGTLSAALKQHGLLPEVLDGDVVRSTLWRELGYAKEDRDRNVERIAWLAARLTRHGAPVVVAAVSPYRSARARARALIEEFGPFVEVWVHAPPEECARRDVKGLYARARAGELHGLTGYDDPYEPPTSPELAIDTTVASPADAASLVLDRLGSLDALSISPVPGEQPAPRPAAL